MDLGSLLFLGFVVVAFILPFILLYIHSEVESKKTRKVFDERRKQLDEEYKMQDKILQEKLEQLRVESAEIRHRMDEVAVHMDKVNALFNKHLYSPTDPFWKGAIGVQLKEIVLLVEPSRDREYKQSIYRYVDSIIKSLGL